MADFWMRYDDFKGGEWGEVDPSRANSDTFHGNNVYPYGSRLLGPRAGLKQLAVSGLPDQTVAGGPAGFAAWNSTLLVVINNRVYQVPMAGGAATAWATYPAPVTTPVRFAAFNQTMYSLVNGVLYKHNGTTSTTAITTPSSLSQVRRWNYWLIGVDRVVPWRLWYSLVDASGPNPDSWPANNYVDVGNNDPITALVGSYNTLHVGKREGWWAVSGVLGTLASVRETVIGNGPTDDRTTTVTTDNRIIYWPKEKIPAFFNGERVSLEDEHRMEPRNSPYMGDSVVVTPTARRLILAGDNSGVTNWYTWKDQAWSYHRSTYRLGAFAPADVRAGYDLPEHVVYAVRRASTIGEPTVICSINHDLDRPAHADDTYAAPSDFGESVMVRGSADLPAWYDPQGRQCTVRSVIVQFRKWPSGVADTYNRLHCQVDVLGPYGRGYEPGEPKMWTEPCARAASGGEDESWRINVGSQGAGNGFMIRFPVISGVAIREVNVAINIRSDRT